MSQKRSLEDWERAECAALKELVEAYNNARPRQERITQEAAGAALGITQGAFSNYLNARIALNKEIAAGISRLFGIPVEKFSQRLAAEIADMARAVAPTAQPEPARHGQGEASGADSSTDSPSQGARNTSFAIPQAAKLIAKAFADGLLKGDDLDEIARMARHLIRKNAASAAAAVPEHLEGLAEAAIRTAEAGENPTDMLKMIGHGLKKTHAKEDPQPDARPSKKHNS